MPRQNFCLMLVWKMYCYIDIAVLKFAIVSVCLISSDTAEVSMNLACTGYLTKVLKIGKNICI